MKAAIKTSDVHPEPKDGGVGAPEELPGHRREDGVPEDQKNGGETGVKSSLEG